MKSKKIFFILTMIAVIAGGACDRDAMYDNLQKFADDGGVLYPEMLDTIYGRIGFERIEIFLRTDGRIPASKITMGKAQKTVVVYDEDTPDPVEIIYDSICSWVNIDGLSESRLYRFKVFTEDRYGSRSIPQEISLVPYTVYDRDILALGIAEPDVSVSSSTLVMEWNNGLHNIMSEYHGLKYEYCDADGILNSGSLNRDPRIYATNLPEHSEVNFNMTYRMLPILDNGLKLLDTIEIQKSFVVQMPEANNPFYPAEPLILRANGMQTFTFDEADKLTELTYPMNMSTFTDLFYFTNVHTLNLTGKGLPASIETLRYSMNDVTTMVGGGAWQEFKMPVDQPARIRQNTGFAPQGLQTLKDALDKGQITKILYIPKTMGTEFDKFLQPYVDSGVVELLNADNPFFPNVVYIDPQFYGNGWVQNVTWGVNMSYSGNFLPRPGFTDISKFDPTNDFVNGSPIDLKLEQLIQNDGKNIYRVVIYSMHPTFFFALPREWRFDNAKYRYLKYKMFIGSSITLLSNTNNDNHHIYREPWNRQGNTLFDPYLGYSEYGQAQWDAPINTPFSDDEIRTTWREYVIDMSRNDGGDNSDYRNRVYMFNFGREQNVTWTYSRNSEIVIYIADVRLCKTISD